MTNEIKQYKQKFANGTKVHFDFNDAIYEGRILHCFINSVSAKEDGHGKPLYSIKSGDIDFHLVDESRINDPTQVKTNSHKLFVGDNEFELKEIRLPKAFDLSAVHTSTFESPIEQGETFVTENGSTFSIFSHYENDENDEPLIHIETNVNDLWSKDDVWEFVEELLNSVGELPDDIPAEAEVNNTTINVDMSAFRKELLAMVYEQLNRENILDWQRRA